MFGSVSPLALQTIFASLPNGEMIKGCRLIMGFEAVEALEVLCRLAVLRISNVVDPKLYSHGGVSQEVTQQKSPTVD